MKTVNIKPTPTTFLLPADCLVAAYAATSKEETRYYLNGVYCEKTDTGKLHLTATDGHVLLHCSDLPNVAFIGPESFILKCDVSDKAFKAKVERKLWVHGDMETGLLQMVSERKDPLDTNWRRVGVLEFEKIDGTFPDYRRVMPKITDRRTGFAMNPAKIKQLADGIGKLDASPRDFAMRFDADSEGNPVRVTWPCAVGWTGIIMPMRT